MTTDISILNPTLQTSKEMSKRYIWMDTQKIVNTILGMTSKGEQVFELRSIQTKKSQKGTTVGRGIHIVRLKTITPYEMNGDLIHPEIVIKNSYDGSCPLECYVGVFRVVCTNGMIVRCMTTTAISKIDNNTIRWFSPIAYAKAGSPRYTHVDCNVLQSIPQGPPMPE